MYKKTNKGLFMCQSQSHKNLFNSVNYKACKIRLQVLLIHRFSYLRMSTNINNCQIDIPNHFCIWVHKKSINKLFHTSHFQKGKYVVLSIIVLLVYVMNLNQGPAYVKQISSQSWTDPRSVFFFVWTHFHQQTFHQTMFILPKNHKIFPFMP